MGGQIFYLSFNQKNENYKNEKFLDAMRYAIDYQGMADTFLKGTNVVHQAFLPKGYLGALEDTPYTLDIEKAKALVAELGIQNPKIVLDVRNAADRMDMAQSIQNTFGQAGITVELNVGEGAEQLKRYRARQHDGTLQSWGPDYPDPHTNASAFAMNADNSDEAQTGGLAWRNAYDPGPLHAQTEAAVMEARCRQAQGDVRGNPDGSPPDLALHRDVPDRLPDRAARECRGLLHRWRHQLGRLLACDQVSQGAAPGFGAARFAG